MPSAVAGAADGARVREPVFGRPDRRQPLHAAVRLPDDRAEQVEHRLLRRYRARRRSVEHALHRRQVVAVADVGLERGDADELRGHHVHVRHALGLDEAKECFGVESLHEDDGLRRRERLQRVAVRRAVVERQAREVHLVGAGEAPEVEQRRVRTRAVRPGPGAGGADDGLGSAGRARGVHACRRRSPAWSRPGSARPTARRSRARIRHRRGAWARGRRRGRSGSLTSSTAPESREEVVELVGRRPPRSRHQPRAEPRARQRDLHPLRTVAEHGRDRGIGPDAPRAAGPAPAG